jgi:hypothetical protein
MRVVEWWAGPQGTSPPFFAGAGTQVKSEVRVLTSFPCAYPYRDGRRYKGCKWKPRSIAAGAGIACHCARADAGNNRKDVEKEFWGERRGRSQKKRKGEGRVEGRWKQLCTLQQSPDCGGVLHGEGGVCSRNNSPTCSCTWTKGPLSLGAMWVRMSGSPVGSGSVSRKKSGRCGGGSGVR